MAQANVYEHGINQLNGIIYGWNRDYDHLESENAVTNLLVNGFCNKNL